MEAVGPNFLMETTLERSFLLKVSVKTGRKMYSRFSFVVEGGGHLGMDKGCLISIVLFCLKRLGNIFSDIYCEYFRHSDRVKQDTLSKDEI